MTAEGPDIGGLLSQMQAMQEQLMEAQETAASEVVEGSAGGGVVRVRITGGFDVQEVIIDPAAVDPADVEMLQDLVVAAFRDAVARVNELNQQALGGIGSLLGGLGLGGADLPGLPGGPQA